MFFIDIAAYRVGMVHGKEAPFLEEARSLCNAIREEDFDFTPVAARPRNAMGPANNIGRVLPWAVDRRGVQFIIRQHRSHAFVRWNALERYSRWRSKSSDASVAQLFGPLHVPVNFVL